jgi:hypothetical protein
MNPTQLCLQQGATLRKAWTWFSGNDVVKPISAAVLGYPTVLTATAHGLPVGWIPVSLVDVGDLSSESLDLSERIPALKVDANSFQVMVDSLEFAPITSGRLVYTPPKDLTGFTASASFVTDPADIVSLLSLTDISGINLGGTEGTVEMVITAAQSLLLPSYTYWQLKLVAPAGDTYRFREGNLTTSPVIAP